MSTTTEQELTPTSKVRMASLWQAIKDRGWGIGTVLECCEPNHDGTRDRIRIVKINSVNGPALNSLGNYDVPVGDPWHGKFGAAGGIITMCEYPAGGKVTAFSLNCRDWREAN